ncbi:glutamyl-tRNA reductase [compost metagenome]
MVEDILLVHRKSNRKFSEVLQDAPVWSTCLRQILFCSENDFAQFADAFESDDQVLKGESALALLLEILCGLHSPIVGETEVFGQFKNFVESRKKMDDALFGDHQKWLNFIFAEVKKMRSQHLVGVGSQSYGSLIRRYSKEFESATICGSGQLALEILPWLALKKDLQLICRDPSKMQDMTTKYNNLHVASYNEAFIHGEALVIAAPLSDERIMELLRKQDTRPKAIYDLRGEENQMTALLRKEFPHLPYMGLQQFFAEIEETKKETQGRIQIIKTLILEKALTFMQRTELRPLGWDDICA